MPGLQVIESDVSEKMNLQMEGEDFGVVREG
jgi:hypothetical protein